MPPPSHVLTGTYLSSHATVSERRRPADAQFESLAVALDSLPALRSVRAAARALDEFVRPAVSGQAMVDEAVPSGDSSAALNQHVSSALLNCARRWQSAPLLALLPATITALSAHASFVDAFTAEWLAACKPLIAQRNACPQVCVQLSRMWIALATAVDVTTFSSDRLAALIDTHAALLEKLDGDAAAESAPAVDRESVLAQALQLMRAGGIAAPAAFDHNSHRRRSAQSHACLELFKARPALLERYSQHALAQPLTRSVLSHTLLSNSLSVSADWKKAALQHCESIVLSNLGSSSAATTFASSNAFEVALQSVTFDEFTAACGGSIQRLLKRSPESLAPILRRWFSLLAGDASAVAESQLFAPLLAELLTASRTDAARIDLLRVLIALVAKCTTAASLSKFIAQSCDALQGKLAGVGALSSPSQRICVLAVLDAVFDALSTVSAAQLEGFRKATATATTAVVEFLKKEAHKDVRRAAWHLLTAQLLRTKGLADTYIPQWAVAAKDKDQAPAALSAMHSLLSAVDSKAILAHKDSKELVASAGKLLTGAAAAPALGRIAGMSALCALSALSPLPAADVESLLWSDALGVEPVAAASSSKSKAPAKDAKETKEEEAKEHWAHSFNVVRKLNEDDAAWHWRLAATVCVKHDARLRTLQNNGLFTALALLLLHADAAVRRASLLAAAELLKQNTHVAGLLLNGLRCALDLYAAIASAPQPVLPPASAFIQAAICLIASSLPECNSIPPLLFALAHHPFTTASASHATWHAVSENPAKLTTEWGVSIQAATLSGTAAKGAHFDPSSGALFASVAHSRSCISKIAHLFRQSTSAAAKVDAWNVALQASLSGLLSHSQSMLRDGSAEWREAAAACIASLVHFDISVLPSLSAWWTSELARATACAALTEDELAIYRTPKGQIYRSAADIAKQEAAVATAAAKKKPETKGKKTKEQLEEEEWERKYAEKQKAAAASSASQSHEKDPEFIRLSREQDEIRSKVRQQLVGAEAVLAATNALLLTAASKHVDEQVPWASLIDALSQLSRVVALRPSVRLSWTHALTVVAGGVLSVSAPQLGVALLANAQHSANLFKTDSADLVLVSVRVLDQLLGSLPAHSEAMSHAAIADEVDALYAVDSDERTVLVTNDNDTVEETERAEADRIRGRWLSPLALNICLPLLRTVVARSVEQAAVQRSKVLINAPLDNLWVSRAAALRVITAHCAAASHTAAAGSDKLLTYPVSDLSADLLSCFASLPATRRRARAALRTLAPSLSAFDLQPLLGMHGLLSGDHDVRICALQVLLAAPAAMAPQGSSADSMVCRIWLAAHYQGEENKEVADLAHQLWKHFGCELPSTFASELSQLLGHTDQVVRQAAASSISAALEKYLSLTAPTLDALMAAFEQSQDVIVEDSFRRDSRQVISKWEARAGVMMAISAAATAASKPEAKCNDALLSRVFAFVVERGLADRSVDVWQSAVAAGQTIIEALGATHVNSFQPTLERCVEKPPVVESEEIGDRISEGVVVLLGGCARHLPVESPKVGSALTALLEALNVPSHSVQKAVSECLGNLAPTLPAERHQPLIDQLMTRIGGTVSDVSFAERKGASLGLAGIVRGLKIAALKKHNIMQSLTSLVETKGQPGARQGAMLAYEALFNALGAKFEPYVNLLLPHLLLCFGDTDQDVRACTQDTAQVVMANLTEHGVRMVLPLLLKSLEESNNWRSQIEAVGMLGSMAFCAPKQLSTCLPQLVPRMLQTLTNPHAKVQDAATNALKSVGSVIRNPEVQLLVPQLLAAFTDSAPATLSKALQALADTSFVHAVDAPSLSLIMPILRRSLHARTIQLKKTSAQITGSICSLIGNIKDVLPYAPDLLEDFKTLIVDSNPEVRANAGKALGQLYKGLGETQFDGLVPWLMGLLKSDTTSVERSGAAQALAEVLAASSNGNVLEKMLPELLSSCRGNGMNVREGYLSLFIFLPKAFGDRFGTYVEQVLPVVIQSLADDMEPVRDSAFRAAQVLVFMFARSHTDLLLPALQLALVDDAWRIREAGTRLLGDELHRLAGAKSAINYDTEDLPADALDEDAAAAAASASSGNASAGIREAIEVFLGRERHDQVLSLLYIVRADVTVQVRTTAWRVWKSIVANTPRLLRELLPTLMDQIIFALATPQPDRQQSAGRTLGELVSKMGEAVLPVIVPILSRTLQSTSSHARQGVGLGLGELLRAANKAHIGAYMKELVPTIQRALCDGVDSVRRAASFAFAVLLKYAGQRAIEDIVPSMVQQLLEEGAKGGVTIVNAFETEDGEEQHSEAGSDGEKSEHSDEESESDDESYNEDGDESEDDDEDDDMIGLLPPDWLGGVRQVLEIAGDKVLPHLIPRLLHASEDGSVTVFSAQCLAALSDSFDDSLHPFLPEIVRTLVKALASDQTPQPDVEQILGAAKQFVLEGVTEDGIHKLITTLVETIDAAGPRAIMHDGRQAAVCAQLIGFVCADAPDEFGSYVPMILQALLPLLNARFDCTLDAALDALEACINAVEKEELLSHVSLVYHAVHHLRIDHAGDIYLNSLPAFSRPKGLAPLWPLYQHGLLYGSSDVRAMSANGVGELIDLTPIESLKPLVVSKLAGPLIRIVGDRFPPAVKTAILQTLNKLIVKAGKHLRQFVPPLQTAFVKTLYDPSPVVRRAGGKALAGLMQLQPKVEPLITEFMTAIRTKTDPALRATLFDALRGILRESLAIAANGMITLSPASQVALRDCAIELAANAVEASVRAAAARCLGFIARVQQGDAAFEAVALQFVLSPVPLSEDTPVSQVDRSLQARSEALGALAVADPTRLMAHTPLAVELCVQTMRATAAATRVSGAIAAYQLLRMLIAAAAPALAASGEALVSALLNMCVDEVIDCRLAGLERLAALGKYTPAFIAPYSRRVVPVAFGRLADSTLPVKHSAKHTIYFCLQLHLGDAELQQKVLYAYARAAPDEDGRAVLDYCRKHMLQFRPDASVTELSDDTPADESKEEEPEESDDDDDEDSAQMFD